MSARVEIEPDTGVIVFDGTRVARINPGLSVGVVRSFELYLKQDRKSIIEAAKDAAEKSAGLLTVKDLDELLKGME